MTARGAARRSAGLACGVALAVGLNAVWWGNRIPAGGAPDENEHFAVVEFVAQHGRLPHYGDPGFTVSLMNSMTHERVENPADTTALNPLIRMNHRFELRQPYLFVPQMPYALNGWFCRLSGGATRTRARWFDALCIATAALGAFVAARALWPDRPLHAAAAAACVGFWPQVTFLGAYVNDDAFAVATSSLLVAACAVWQRACAGNGPHRASAVWLGVACGLAGSSKPYVLVLLPPAVACTAFAARRAVAARPGDPQLRRRIVWLAVLALGIASAIAGAWLVRNALLYDGDPTGRRFLHREMHELVQALPPPVAARTKLLFLAPAKERPALHVVARAWLTTTFASFWARFGWMNIWPPRPFGWAALVVVGGLLTVSLARRSRAPVARSAPPASDARATMPRRHELSADPARSWWAVPRIFAVPAGLLLLVASMLNSYWIDYQPQGRYLLACVPGLVLQMSTTLRGHWVLVLVLFFVAENLACRILVLH